MSGRAESIASSTRAPEDRCLVRIVTGLAFGIYRTVGFLDGLIRGFLGVACDG